MAPQVAKRILVVEDEDAIRETLRYNLAREGYTVSEAATGTDALIMARAERPDLILLDVMLPGLSGLEVCRVLRQESSTPILMLTAKGTEVDKVVGLQLGADDYVTKPFSFNELLARVTALLRRSEMSARPAGVPEVDEFDGFRIDRAARTIHLEGAELRLAPKEFDLLSLLLRNSGRVLSRQAIIAAVWGNRFFGDPKTVDVHVRWLREKFEPFARMPFRITTVFGVGYRLDRVGASEPSP
jgi:DNA-binding response OmpR family regulator